MTIHFEKKTLPNGLRLITAPMHDTKAVTILIMVGAGSRFEDARTNGVAHFLEHMFFKGTQKRPTTLEISRELDALGADYNAFTGEEYTGFYVRVAADDFAQAFDIITDMLLDPLFLEEEIEREKGVIVEELNMYEDTPMRIIHDHAKALIYGDTPLGRNIGGTKDIVTKFVKKDFIDFREKYYKPDNLLVVIAGAGNEQHWETAVSQRLGHLGGQAQKEYEKAIIQQKTPAVHLGKKKTDQAHLVMGYHSFGRNDERRPILEVLANIFGGSMSSRLFIEVRERRGLAYYIKADTWFFQDTGVFAARAGVQVDKIDEAIRVIKDEFRQLASVLVTEEELDRTKKNLRGSMYLGLEQSMAIADFVAEQELFEGKIVQPEDLVKAWEKVTREDLRELAKEIVSNDHLNLAIIGPYEDPERFKGLVAEK